jgi:hypothetical protein
MTMGKIRKMFPGNNTSEGFYSFYHQMIFFPAEKVFILKGGPGSGKSTLMKKVGAEIVKRGFAAEYHYCSSDNESLDGLVIPDLKMAILDGTAPHVVDPKYPGVVENMVNLGDFWDEPLLRRNKEKIIEINKQKGQMFRLAYEHLREAKVVQEQLESYHQEALDVAGVRKLLFFVKESALNSITPQFTKACAVRRLFASANTSRGYVHHLDSILQDARKLYLLRGEVGTGKTGFLKALYYEAVNRGIDLEVYHCPFAPQRIELLYLPQPAIGFLRVDEPLAYEPVNLYSLQACRDLDFDQFLKTKELLFYQQERKDAKKRLLFLRNEAWNKLKMAKVYHDQLEKLYFPTMNFEDVNQKREELLEKILSGI